jgi:GINS complex subunit 3
MSYYDLDSILTDSQKLPCTFELDVPGLGYLEGDDHGGQSLKSGTKVDLPLWLGVMLAVSNSNNPTQSPMVTLDFPAPLQTRVINALKADPKSVDLRAQSAHFYGIGAKVLEIFDDEAVVDVLIDVSIFDGFSTIAKNDTDKGEKTFKKRASEIADHAHNPRGALGEGAEFLRGLDEFERQLFKAAHEGPKAVRQWQVDLKKNS